MALKDQERYIRANLLAQKGGKFVGEQILMRELKRLPGSPSLFEFLDNKPQHIMKKKYPYQFHLLYPSSKAATDVTDWDEYAVLKFILGSFKTTLQRQDVSDLNEIQQIRCDVCHPSDPTMSESTFSLNMDALITCITRLSRGLDINTAVKATIIIAEKMYGPLSSKEVEMMTQIGIHNDFMKTSSDAQARIESKQEEDSTKFNAKLDELLEILKRAPSSEIQIPKVQTQLNISGNEEKDVANANDLVLTHLHAAIDKSDDPNDKEMVMCVTTDNTGKKERRSAMVSPTDENGVKRTVREMVQEIESQTAKVVSAEKGSIFITIQCNTLSGLKNLLVWLKEKEYRSCLHNLERALERNFLSKFDVDLTLSNGSILELSNLAGLCMSNLVNAKTEELPYKAKVNIAVKCQSAEAVSRVVKYFTHGDSANRLNNLSETLSNAVGGRIRVNATLDTGRLLTDLEKAETDLPLQETSAQLTQKKPSDEHECTDIKPSDDENSSNTDQALPSFKQDVSNISIDVDEKFEIDPSIRETSPQLTTQKSSDEPGYTDIKTNSEGNTSKTDQASPTLEQDVSNISLDVSEKAETNLPMLETSPQLTIQTLPGEPGYTDIKTSDEENTYNTDQTLQKLEQDVSNISLDVNEKAETDPSMLETSPLLTTQPSSDKPGYKDIKTSDDENAFNIYQAFPTLEQDVSKLSLHANFPWVQLSSGRDRNKMKPQMDLEKSHMDLEKTQMDLEMDLEKMQMDLEKTQMDLEKTPMDLEKRQKDLEKRRMDHLDRRHTDREESLWLEKMLMDISKRWRDLRKSQMDLEKPHMDLEKRWMDLEKPHIDLEKRQMNLEKPHMDLEKTRVDLEKRQKDLEKRRMDHEKSLMDMKKWIIGPRQEPHRDPVTLQMDCEETLMGPFKLPRTDQVTMQMDCEETLMDQKKRQKDLVEQKTGMVKMQRDREKTLMDYEKP